MKAKWAVLDIVWFLTDFVSCQRTLCAQGGSAVRSDLLYWCTCAFCHSSSLHG